MSRQYRAIWRDSHEDLIAKGRSACQDWLHDKGFGLPLPEVGVEKSGPYEVSVDRVIDEADSDVEALRVRLVEIRDPSGYEEQWTTTALWMTDGGNGWIWIDLEWISEDVSLRRHIYAPGLVRRLLATRQPSLIPDNLGPDPTKVNTEEDIDALFERLYQETRTVPLVLYSYDDQLSINEYEQRATLVARRLAGCADVWMLTETTQNRFHELFDLVNLSVFGGAVRIYLPSLDRYDPQPWKHRYIHRRFLSSDPRIASNRIVEPILRRMIAQKPPSIYIDRIRDLLIARNRDWEELAMELDTENKKLEADNERLLDEIADIDDQRDWAIEEAKESERDAYKLLRRLDRLRAQLRVLDTNPDAVEQQVAEDSPPSSCREAIERANELSHVIVHAEAPQEIERLDQDEDSELWGQRMYRQLLALEAYAVAKSKGFDGNLKTWCDTSGHDRAIPSKFVALSESESVRNSSWFKTTRTFPIDHAISPNGQIVMYAHLKVVQGGGMHIPRIYLHDDTMRSGLIHVGFIGPHDLVPNLSRN